MKRKHGAEIMSRRQETIELAAAFDSVTRVGVVCSAAPPAVEIKDHLVWLQPLPDGDLVMWLGWKGEWIRASGGASH